jgi:methionine-rich copper-binding protein CopC
MNTHIKIQHILISALLLAVTGGSLFLGSAHAHAAYLRSAPGNGALVSDPPVRVDIWFTQDLFRRKGENTIQVFDPAQNAVQTGEVQVDNDDRRHLWVELRPGLAPGVYRVDWRSLSAEDADADQGSFSFTYDPQAALTSTPMGAASPTLPTPEPTSATPPAAAPQATQPLEATQAGPAALPAGATPTPVASQSRPSFGCASEMVLLGMLLGAGWLANRRKHRQP